MEGRNLAIAGQSVRIEMTTRQQSFEIPADQEPASVTLDPNTWMLMDSRFAKR